MPLVRVDLQRGKPADYRRLAGEVIYEAMRSTINVPEDDHFQILTEHDPGDLVFSPDYVGIHRTDDCIFVQIVLSEGRSLELKRALYKAIADGLHAKLGLRREDVFIVLVEVNKVNWSFGNGEATYA
jgi:4-oxalocrotonate tautomerase